jgi:hypothetical protein
MALRLALTSRASRRSAAKSGSGCRQLAEGLPPEANAALAARAMRLTAMEYRRDLAASLRGILAAAGLPSAVAHRPRVPVYQARIRQSASELALLAGRLVEPGPVPVRGVAMTSQLLADGRGPLYREACRDDLAAILQRAARALVVQR